MSIFPIITIVVSLIGFAAEVSQEVVRGEVVATYLLFIFTSLYIGGRN